MSEPCFCGRCGGNHERWRARKAMQALSDPPTRTTSTSTDLEAEWRRDRPSGLLPLVTGLIAGAVAGVLLTLMATGGLW